MLERIINTQNMLKFYEEFNAIDFKYSLNRTLPNYVEQYNEIEKFESSYHFNELTKIEYGDIQTNLDLIYAREKESDDTVFLFDLVRKKVINQYINIEGVERLFSEKYVDFEWDMHLGMDHKKHKMNYYRDHFVHQIRVAYSIHQLLDEKSFNVLHNVKAVLKDKSNSKISRYVSNYIEQQKHYIDGKKFTDYLLQSILAEQDNCEETLSFPNGHVQSYENELDNFYYRNIIYTACYLSGLFHDIGYPETSNTLNQKRIKEYIANLYNAESSGYNYGKLNALLQNSLLFRVVSFEEIQTRIAKDNPDHGVLSAIIFLLHFYENGAIHGLEPYKKCAVELAALSIYNHTNKYTYNRGNHKDTYVRISFLLNPISYLLRLCDDLQEWGRIYFELSHCSNLIMCKKCKTPIIRKKCANGELCYICNCDSEEGVFEPFFEYNSNFPYRRIYNVTVCEQLVVKQKNNILKFYLDYNLDRLLHIAYLNAGYASYRTEDLNKVKKILDYQSELPAMKLDYFVTANPVLIKTQILREYCYQLSHYREQVVIEELWNQSDIISRMLPGDEKESSIVKWREKFDESLSEMTTRLIKKADKIYGVESGLYLSAIKQVVEESINLYSKLFFFMEMYKLNNQKYAGRKNENEFLKTEVQSNTFKREYTEDLNGLLQDCLKQFETFYVDMGNIGSNPSNYYEQFVMNDYTYGCIQRYTSTNNYIPVCGRKTKEIDAFTDLTFFKSILKELSSEKGKQR